MKIAITCPAFLPATQFGGILFLALDIAKELSKKNCDVTIYTSDLDFANNSKTFNKNLPRIEKMENFVIKRSHVMFHIELFFVTIGMYKQILKDRPEIIHAIGIRGFQAFISALISKVHKIPLIISDQGGLYTHPDFQKKGKKRIFYKIQEPIIKFIINQANKIMVANEYEYSIFSKYCKSNKLEIIKNGIDVKSLQNCPFDFKKKNNLNERLILFLGRFAEVKGIDILLESFSELIKEENFDNVKLVIMGADFGYADKMYKIIEKSNLKNRVLVVEKPDRKEVISAYYACDFLVLPSRWEMSPLTPLEGFACKKPTISTRIHGIPYVVKDEENGLLFEPENTLELKQKMAELLLDENKRKKLGDQGYEMVQNVCNNEIMAKYVLNMYEGVLNLKESAFKKSGKTV